MGRPVALFTDFGLHGPYVGMMKAAVLAQAPQAVFVDLLADAPAFDPRSSAYLLAAMLPFLPADSIVLAVVDPGVGGARQPLLAEVDGRILLGPDNGLLEMVLRHGQSVRVWRIDWQPPVLSATFHGRDLFAPLAGRLVAGENPKDLPLSPAMTGGFSHWPEAYPYIIYEDPYGNLMTGLREHNVGPQSIVQLAGRRISYARTFSDVSHHTVFWTINSIGLLEIACNCGHAGRYLGASIGSGVEIL